MTAPRSHYTDRFGKCLCHDCQSRPENRHFTVVPSEVTAHVGPNVAELYGNFVLCDPCFLRRRLEGKL